MDTIYLSSKGSEVRLNQKHQGRVEISFDWSLEQCCSQADPRFDPQIPAIIAECECCPSKTIDVKLSHNQSIT